MQESLNICSKFRLILHNVCPTSEIKRNHAGLSIDDKLQVLPELEAASSLMTPPSITTLASNITLASNTNAGEYYKEQTVEMGVKRSEMALYVWFTHNPAEGVEISGLLLTAS